VGEQGRHTLKQAAIWVPLVTGTILFLVSVGVCNTPVQTTQEAIKAQLTLKTEVTAQMKLISDQAEKREDLNRQAHDKIFDELKDQRDGIAKTQADILRLQVDTLKELRAITNAPSGPTFQRGRQVNP
jgi:hypothetical protein